MRIQMGEMRMRKNARRGSTLGWVIVVIMVVMILMMSALTMSASHIYRYQRYHDRRQINMTAISVAKSIASELERGSGENGFSGIMERMLEDSEEGEVSLGGLDEQMGEVRLLYSFDGERLVLTVQVQLGTETGQTRVTMRKGGSRETGKAWELMGFGAEEMELDEYETEEES